MSPLKPRDVQREIRALLAAADRETLAAAGLMVVQRAPLDLLVIRLEVLAEILSRNPRSPFAHRLRPEIQNCLYLLDLLLEKHR
jgi:hypothetical protein